jgi:hypothetical protein
VGAGAFNQGIIDFALSNSGGIKFNENTDSFLGFG